MATEVRSGRGKIPVADYKVVKYINGDDVDTPFGRRSCYSVCMCPGGQVMFLQSCCMLHQHFLQLCAQHGEHVDNLHPDFSSFIDVLMIIL